MYADLIFLNGQIITVDAQDTISEAVAARGDRILAVGPSDEVIGLRGPKTKVIDLAGKSVLPGIIDAHAHLWSYGLQRLGVDCSYKAVKSISDIVKKFKVASEKTPEGQWLRGWSYNENYLREQRHPTRFDLDKASSVLPIYLRHVSAHVCVLNSKAIEIVGFNKDSPDPTGGKIERDEHGYPTGVLYEAANNLAQRASLPSYEELKASLLLASKDFVAQGVTSVHDAWGLGRNQVKSLCELERSGELKLRVYEFLGSFAHDREFFEYFKDAGLMTGFGNDRLRLGPVKAVVDGDPTAGTASLQEPYTSKPNDTGIIRYSQDKLDDLFARSHKAGFQVTAHAAGDKAISMVLSALEKVFRLEGRRNARPRIEHCALLNRNLLQRIKKLRVVPIPQPAFFHDFGDAFVKDYGDRTEMMFPCKSFHQMGIVAAGSSDCPVTSFNPFQGIYQAMARTSKSGCVIGAGERVGLQEAIRLFTINGAYASCEKGIKGSIEPGKLADMVVLPDNILKAAQDEVREMSARLVVIGGEVVYVSGDFKDC